VKPEARNQKSESKSKQQKEKPEAEVLLLRAFFLPFAV
jgi:hypothetical protein